MNTGFVCLESSPKGLHPHDELSESQGWWPSELLLSVQNDCEVLRYRRGGIATGASAP
jgi:hypothetical protein